MPQMLPSLEIAGPLARIELRRAHVANRLELEDIETLGAQLRQVEADSTVRALLISARGRHFCSGFNIGSVPGRDAGALFEELAAQL
ncbi:MAG TPA: enoyl-CoA hydratase/isomerase family protein, partial [Burkholderiaceae bacterium]